MTANSIVSGIVLAGGMSRRLGRNKAVEPIGGEALIARVIGRLSQVTDQTVVVVNGEEWASGLPLPDSAKVVADVFPGKGKLGGMFTGLSAADGQWGVVVACDMPFLNADLFRRLLALREGADAVVPMLKGLPEPMHAVYHKACLPAIEGRLKTDDLKIVHFFSDVRVSYLPEPEVDSLDPEHLSFFNINTEEDLNKALALVAAGA